MPLNGSYGNLGRGWGSATVDGGAGCLLALGARLLDANQRLIKQRWSLNQIASIDATPCVETLQDQHPVLAM